MREPFVIGGAIFIVITLIAFIQVCERGVRDAIGDVEDLSVKFWRGALAAPLLAISFVLWPVTYPVRLALRRLREWLAVRRRREGK